MSGKINAFICKVISLLTGSNDDISQYKNLRKFKLHSRTALREKIILADFTDVPFGLADRLIGLLSLYMFAKETGRKFKIRHTCGFRLEEYLLPNTEDWIIKPEDIAYGLNESRPLITSFCRNRLNKNGLPRLSDGILQYHAYINHDLREHIPTRELEKYDRCALFNELFKPSPHLQELLDKIEAGIGNAPYVAVHFRFMNFFEAVETGAQRATATEEEMNDMLTSCKKHLETIHQLVPDKNILIFTDSERFQQEDFPDYVKKLPGKIGHISAKHADMKEVLDKTFTDLFMISRAAMVINVTGKNLRKSGFSRLAAEFGGAPFIIRDADAPYSPLRA